MTKKEFIIQHEISDAVPIDPSKKTLPAESLSLGIWEFMEHKFSGAIKVSCGDISAQSVSVCAEYLAFFFKTLLTDIYGRVFLTMDITSDEQGLNLMIRSDAPLPLTDSEMRQLIRLARNGGLEILPDTDSIKLTVGFSPVAYRRVYATSIRDGRRIMIGKLIEIFCHGELMNTDPPPPRKMPKPIEKRPTRKKNK